MILYYHYNIILYDNDLSISFEFRIVMIICLNIYNNDFKIFMIMILEYSI